MTSNLKDAIVEELDIALSRWAVCRRETKDVVARLRKYYGNIIGMSKEDAIRQAKEDMKEIPKHLTEHEEIAAKAKNSSRNLKEQVQSSESAVLKMRKHGRPAALGFTVLGVIIGLAIGLKAPGFGQVIAVVVCVILGGFCFGCFALATYLFMSSNARRKEKMWKRAKDDNEVGLGLAKVVEPKRMQLGEIYNVLDDLQEGNYDMTIASIVSEMDEYMNDSAEELQTNEN